MKTIRRLLLGALLAVHLIGHAHAQQSIPKPGISYKSSFFDCQARGIGWCYAFSTLREPPYYVTYFFAPATHLDAGECVFRARSTSLTSSDWEIQKTDGSYERLAVATSTRNWAPMVCRAADQLRSTVSSQGGLGQNAGWTSMWGPSLAGSVAYIPGPPKLLALQLTQNKSVPNHSHFSAAFGVPPGFGITDIWFDYETNYDNGLIYGGVSSTGHQLDWAKDEYGYRTGSAHVVIREPNKLPDASWISFGMFSRQAFQVQSPSWIFYVRNAVYDAVGPYQVGDPSVFKHNGLYYMLYSVQRMGDGTPGYVYGAKSVDGRTWTGQTQLWIGHRPSTINDGTTVRAWYDIHTPKPGDPNNPNTIALEMRTIPTAQLANILNPSSWSAPQFGASRQWEGNSELSPMGSGYFLVSDSGGNVGYSYTPDGLNFDPQLAASPLASVADIPCSTALPCPRVGNDVKLGVPQLFREGLDTFLIATVGYPPAKTFLFRVDMYSSMPPNAGSSYYAGGWTNMQSSMEVPAYSANNGQTAITYRLAQGASVPSHGSSGTSFGPPPGKKIYKVVFDYTTNYNNGLVYAGMTIPGNANFWSLDVYGNNVGTVTLELPDVDWFGLGMFSKTTFVAPANWIFQVRNLKFYYH